MSAAWSRPLVEALGKRRSQAASCHAGLRCHALSSDWVTVQREKVTVSRQHGCHSHFSRTPEVQTRSHVEMYTHTSTHTNTPFNPSRKPEVIWTLCVCVGCFVKGCFIFVPCSLMFHVPLEWSYWWESNRNTLWELSKLLQRHLVSISISYQYSVPFSWCTDDLWFGWSCPWTQTSALEPVE